MVAPRLGMLMAVFVLSAVAEEDMGPTQLEEEGEELLRQNSVQDDPEENVEDEDTSRVLYNGYQLINVTMRSKQDSKVVYSMSSWSGVHFWSIHRWTSKTGGYAHMLLAPKAFHNVTSALNHKNISYNVMLDDIQEVIDEFAAEHPSEDESDFEPKSGHAMSWDRYHRLKDIYSFLDYVGVTYPDICETMVIGNSTEGREMKLVKVSQPDRRGAKPAIWIDGGMHAREWISPAMTTYMIQLLIQSRHLLQEYDFYFLPVANPDGYEYTHEKDRLWRKTRSKHPYTFLCYGVDPNRNFDYHWGEYGSSKRPCSNIFRGPAPFSEPETQAISDFILEHKDEIKIYLTYHSYSQLFLLPWGHTKELPEDYDQLYNVAQKAVEAMRIVHGTEYQLGSTANILYPASGGSTGWAKGAAGIKYSFGIELRDTGDFGFLLPPTEIVPTAEENWQGVTALLKAVKEQMKENEV